MTTNPGQGAGTLISRNFHTLDAFIEKYRNHYIYFEIDLVQVRTVRANYRVHHQCRPDLYEPITEEHQTWKVYDSYSKGVKEDEWFIKTVIEVNWPKLIKSSFLPPGGGPGWG